jgi:hypothetical protein
MTDNIDRRHTMAEAKNYTGGCHCGHVRYDLTTDLAQVLDCNCSICRRLGTIMAYYNPAQVSITGKTETYVWGDKSIAFHRCHKISERCSCSLRMRT